MPSFGHGAFSLYLLRISSGKDFNREKLGKFSPLALPFPHFPFSPFSPKD
jgi:hypothetical protein